MPLLTELKNVLGCDFYKDFAPDGAGVPERGSVTRSGFAKWNAFKITVTAGGLEVLRLTEPRAGCAGTPPRPGWFFLDKISAGAKANL